ncbi:MAG: DNA modification methylase [Candidatus Methanomethylophilaceae archaeon]|nr:DNA modification methylase [Candidatus Methanomethylophilaceae archaeon]
MAKSTVLTDGIREIPAEGYIGGIMPSDMRIIYKPINELIPYKKNPRKNDEASEKLSKLIENRKFRIPILIDGKGTIIAGHTRLKALQRLNYTGEVACIMIEDMTDEEIRAFRLEDNRSQEWSEWDDLLLDEEIGELESLGIEPMGFVRNEPMEVEDIEEDDPPEPPTEAETKPGDMYILGDHRLLCGDSTSEKDMNRLMKDEEADLIVTDPPYNVDYSSKNEMLNRADKGNRVQTPIENDKMDDESFKAFLTDAFCAMYGALRRGGRTMYGTRTAFGKSSQRQWRPMT